MPARSNAGAAVEALSPSRIEAPAPSRLNPGWRGSLGTVVTAVAAILVAIFALRVWERSETVRPMLLPFTQITHRIPFTRAMSASNDSRLCSRMDRGSTSPKSKTARWLGVHRDFRR